MKNRNSQSGDTLIEVLVAISILSLVLVGTFSLMNKAVAQMYDNMERGQVRLLLNSQTETLVYARDQYLAAKSGVALTADDQAAANVWTALNNASYKTSTKPSMDSCTDSTVKTGAFYALSSSGVVSVTAVASPTVTGNFPSPGSGIWVQQIMSSGVTPAYRDFYLRACWWQNSSQQPQILSTVVRLYDQ